MKNEKGEEEKVEKEIEREVEINLMLCKSRSDETFCSAHRPSRRTMTGCMRWSEALRASRDELYLSFHGVEKSNPLCVCVCVCVCLVN